MDVGELCPRFGGQTSQLVLVSGKLAGEITITETLGANYSHHVCKG